MGNPTLLFWGLMFGAIGFGFFTYGRKQQAITPLCVGVALFVIPYFITNVYLLILAGVVLAITPYFIRF